MNSHKESESGSRKINLMIKNNEKFKAKDLFSKQNVDYQLVTYRTVHGAKPSVRHVTSLILLPRLGWSHRLNMKFCALFSTYATTETPQIPSPPAFGLMHNRRALLVSQSFISPWLVSVVRQPKNQTWIHFVLISKLLQLLGTICAHCSFNVLSYYI